MNLCEHVLWQVFDQVVQQVRRQVWWRVEWHVYDQLWQQVEQQVWQHVDDQVKEDVQP